MLRRLRACSRNRLLRRIVTSFFPGVFFFVGFGRQEELVDISLFYRACAMAAGLAAERSYLLRGVCALLFAGLYDEGRATPMPAVVLFA